MGRSRVVRPGAPGEYRDPGLTHETGNLEKLKVPDVCQVLGVPWLNLYDFMERQD
uniref:DUF4411 family protein n=1 Tax=Amycolatopsis sp. CA-096443 TaxID=3239919 RepID=UPI003F49B116